MKIQDYPYAFLSLSLFAFAMNVHAEVLILKNGTKVGGSLKSSDGKALIWQTEKGETKTFSKDDVLSVELFSTPKNLLNAIPEPPTAIQSMEGPFSTPRATFNHWLDAASKGDIDEMARCYVTSKQAEKKKELKKISKTAFEKMKDTTIETQFVASEPLYQGDRAMMEVNWTHGLMGDAQVLQFLLEKNEWRILQ